MADKTRREILARREVLAAGGVLGTALALGLGGKAEAAEEANTEAMAQRMQALAALPDDEPVVMLNLLKFKAGGGEATYGQYGMKMAPMFQKYGIKVLFMAECQQLLIGEKEWDRLILVQYPSRKAFIEMVTSAEYLAIGKTRTDSIVDSALYAMKQNPVGPGGNP